MTHEDKGHFSKKHPEGVKIIPEIAEAIKKKAAYGSITCAAAHNIAKDLNLSPSQVGMNIDLLELSILKCQLGLYGYSSEKRGVNPAETVSEELERAIRDSLVEGRIPCRSLWDIAKRFKIKKMDASSACETLKIKIKPCQLGAF